MSQENTIHTENTAKITTGHKSGFWPVMIIAWAATQDRERFEMSRFGNRNHTIL